MLTPSLVSPNLRMRRGRRRSPGAASTRALKAHGALDGGHPALHSATAKTTHKMELSPTSITATSYSGAESVNLESPLRWVPKVHPYAEVVLPSFTTAGWTSPGEVGAAGHAAGEGWEEEYSCTAESPSELRRLADASGWDDAVSPPIDAVGYAPAPASVARSSPSPTNICWHYIQGKCTAGDACKAVHSTARLPPARGAKNAQGRGSHTARAAQIVARLALMKTRVKPRVQCERCEAHLPHIAVTGARGLHKSALLRKSIERTGVWAPAPPVCHACKGAKFTILVPSFDTIVSDAQGLSYDPASTKKPVRVSPVPDVNTMDTPHHSTHALAATSWR